MDLSIIIVNWNTKELLKDCIKSIYKKTQNIDYEIIIVDNASKDGSVKMLKEEFPQCITIASKENLGFAKGNNRAIQKANGKYILFLNPDTELKTEAIGGMINFMKENDEIGAIGCKLLNRDGSIQFTCARKFPTPFNKFCFLTMLNRIFPTCKFVSSTEMNYWDHLDSREVECLSGACVLTRKKIIDQVGGFDEKFFMYCEDVELCYRIKNHGWRIYYLAGEAIYHYSGASSNQRNESYFSTLLQLESNQNFLADNCGRSKAIQFRIAVFTGSIIRIIAIILILLGAIIYKSNKKQIAIYSIKKYFNIFLWSIRYSYYK